MSTNLIAGQRGEYPFALSMNNSVALRAHVSALRNLWCFDDVRGEELAISLVCGRRRAAHLTRLATSDEEDNGQQKNSQIYKTLTFFTRQRHANEAFELKL